MVNRIVHFMAAAVMGCTGGTGGAPVDATPQPLVLRFAAPTVLPAGAIGANSETVAIADLDGDGDLDIAVTDSGDNRVGVFFNDGTGHFTNEVTFATDATPIAIAAGRITPDDRLDLVTGNAGTNNAGFLPASGATFEPKVAVALLTTPTGIAMADFDGDGDIDSAFPDAAGSLKVLLNAGSSAIAAELQDNAPGGKVTSPRGAVAADFSGDGRPDVAVVDFAGDRAVVWVNDGTKDGGLFPAAGIVTLALPAMSLPQGIAAGDLDHDGLPDIVVPLPGNNSKSVRVFRNRGGAAFDDGTSFPAGADSFQAAIADFDKDGNNDVVALDFLAGNVAVLLGNGDGSLGAQQPFTVGVDAANAKVLPRSVAVGDLDGDGKPDIVVASDLNRAISVLLNVSE